MTPEQKKVATNAYVRILLARFNGTDVHLSSSECWDLSFDAAIETHASHLLDRAGLEIRDGKVVTGS